MLEPGELPSTRFNKGVGGGGGMRRQGQGHHVVWVACTSPACKATGKGVCGCTCVCGREGVTSPASISFRPGLCAFFFLRPRVRNFDFPRLMSSFFACFLASIPSLHCSWSAICWASSFSSIWVRGCCQNPCFGFPSMGNGVSSAHSKFLPRSFPTPGEGIESDHPRERRHLGPDHDLFCSGIATPSSLPFQP